MTTVIGLLLLAVGALALAGYAYVLEQRRRVVLDRALGAPGEGTPARVLLVTTPRAGAALGARLRHALERLLPARWLTDPKTLERLVRAGHDEEHAIHVYVGIRAALLVILPPLALLYVAGSSSSTVVLTLITAVCAALLLPSALLDMKIRGRQERLRRAVPDVLDLLLVCVEAGNSLESAIVRVSRELATVHPELAEELGLVVRRTRAGMPRIEALRALATRTGVEELRTLVTNVVQSDRWGTSIARMLRVSAETLRRKRRQTVERKAQMAPVKMTIPLILFILPALFLVLLGPTVLTLIEAFSQAR